MGEGELASPQHLFFIQSKSTKKAPILLVEFRYEIIHREDLNADSGKALLASGDDNCGDEKKAGVLAHPMIR